ncbi:MAG: DNA polymerase III subunit delta' [Deltaproteobacteria bacterium]|nr:DNA polymerase III subunit delta' [Deltaproteobacteria bacterium]
MWQTILGHERAVARLRDAIAGTRLAPAYLFAGPPGIGKLRTAHVAIQAMLCPAATSEGPCGTCKACARIGAGTHPDVHVLTPEKQEIRIDQVRSMRERVQFHPLEGHAKCVLIDPAEAMHPAAANACLKLLEEPPAATHFFLISAGPHRLLATIRSRCQRIDFTPVPEPILADWLAREHGMTAAQARALAQLAEGSFGMALAYSTDLLAEVVNDARLLPAAMPAQMLGMAERWAADADTLGLRLHLVARACAAQAKASLTGAPDDDPVAAALAPLFARMPSPRLRAHSRAFAEGAELAGMGTVNKQLLCESLLLSLSASR